MCNALDPWAAIREVMRRRRSPRLNRAETDRLLAGGPPGPDQRGLVALLDAAKAPPTVGEWAGEAAAVAAFVAAYRGAAPAPTEPGRVRIPSLARAATMKVAAGVAVLVVGGTAVAAETGALPDAAQHQAHGWFSVLGVPPPAPRSPSPEVPPPLSAGPTTVRPTSTPGPPTTPTPGTSGFSSSTARGLCLAWQADTAAEHGKAMTAKSRRALAALAGDESRIPAFCVRHLTESPSEPATTGQPTTPGVTTGPSLPGNASGNAPDGNASDNANGDAGSQGSDAGEAGASPTAGAAVDGRAGPQD
jgi:hypothetical protein